MNHPKCLSQTAISNTPSLGVILSRDTGFGQGVEKGGFADVGQTHDAAFEAHGKSPYKSRPQLNNRAQHRHGRGARPVQMRGNQSAERTVQKSRRTRAFCPGFVLG